MSNAGEAQAGILRPMFWAHVSTDDAGFSSILHSWVNLTDCKLYTQSEVKPFPKRVHLLDLFNGLDKLYNFIARGHRNGISS
ncbi:hypothetical protein E4T50_01617 [Aureobasidium sp. EXF-12298]|nr:hypothetical protein E4T50_01617 [Aureobasidium sp. EXF-12298]KAI4764607.1 hypothetical protein E4T51_02403 [Aureobasidium sp. EXF-12344]KAI4782183.1 hypothetical protein E4T52_02845 [Aureobasidium sp. EXF-3400]